MLTRVNTTLG